MICERCKRLTDKRSLEQNDRMWAMLEIIAKSTDWHGHKLSKDEWKDLFTAGLRKTKVVPNLEGNGFVMLGCHTSKMSKGEHSDLQTLMEVFAAERGIDLREREWPCLPINR